MTVATWGSFPVPGVQQQVRMGLDLAEDPATDFWWNTQLDNGAYVMADARGWLTTSYITPIDQVGGRDGGLLGPPSIAPKVLQVDTAIVAPTPQVLWETIERVRQLLGPQSLAQRVPVVWDQYDWGAQVRLGLVTRPEGEYVPQIVSGHVPGGYAATATFNLVAANPPWKFKTGPLEMASAGLADPALITGRTYDKAYSWNYGASSAPGGELFALNTGNLDAWLVFTVKGTVVNPIITNATTGRSFQVLATLTDSDTVTVDGRTGIITPGSVRLLGRPFTLAPGANTIRWRGSNDAFDPDALLTVQWRSTYR